MHLRSSATGAKTQREEKVRVRKLVSSQCRQHKVCVSCTRMLP
jgi:hypothetical protein